MRPAIRAALAALAFAASLPAFAGVPSTERSDAEFSRICSDPKAHCSGARTESDLPGFPGCTANAYNAILSSNGFQISFDQFRKAYEMGEPAKMKAAAEAGQRYAAECGEAAKAFFERKAREWGKG